MTPDPRQQLLDAVHAFARGELNGGTSGNLSIRHRGGMLITPSGVPFESLTLDGLVAVDNDGNVVSGSNPSSEWPFHLALYQARQDLHAIVHAHPVYCCALACQRRDIPAFHYMVAVAGGKDIRCAQYATFGSKALSHHVVRAMDGRRAALMANHGLVTAADSPQKALLLANEVERLAHMYVTCLASGEPVLLDDAEMARVLEQFQNYGPGTK